MIIKDELVINMTIKFSEWEKEKTKNDILEFLKTLNIVELEIKEK